MTQSAKFIRRQTVTLLRLGIAEADIERTINFVEKHLPDGIDANTWIPTEADLRDDGVISEGAVVDARLAFFGDRRVPRKMRKILDAREAA